MRLLPAAVLLLAAVPAAAQLPTLRAGLWTQTQTLSGLPAGAPASLGQPRTSRLCIDDAIQKRINVLAMDTGRTGCATPRVSRAGVATVVETVCKAPGGVSSAVRSVIDGDFRTGFRGNATVTTTGMPGAAGPASQTVRMAVVGRYAGACPADMKPGDITSPGLPRMNMLTGMEQVRR